MSKPRTVAQRSADYKRTFPRKANDRRLELIEKQFAGFTEEEFDRRPDLDPGWKEELERRLQANLTDAERAEMAECTRIVDEWTAKSPWAIDRDALAAEREAKVDALLRGAKGRS